MPRPFSTMEHLAKHRHLSIDGTRHGELAKLSSIGHSKLAFEHVIIAGGDDDIDLSHLIEWVLPVLSGLRGAKWIAAEVRTPPARRPQAFCRCGLAPGRTFRAHGFTQDDERAFEHYLPSGDAAFILLDDCMPQVMALLDSTARWLMAFDGHSGELSPLRPALDRICAAADMAKAQNKKGPVSGALLKPAAE